MNMWEGKKNDWDFPHFCVIEKMYARIPFTTSLTPKDTD